MMPRAFATEDRIIYKEQEVLEYVRQSVGKMCEPGTGFLLGESKRGWKKITKRHRQLCQKAKRTKDWVVTVEDVKEVIKYFRKSASRSDACAMSGLTAKMLIKAGPRLEETVWLLLGIIQTCGKIPTHWRMLVLVLLLKPGLQSDEIASYRPVVLAEILSKGLEKALARRHRLCRTDPRGIRNYIQH
jgi:hypothetical protein